MQKKHLNIKSESASCHKVQKLTIQYMSLFMMEPYLIIIIPENMHSPIFCNTIIIRCIVLEKTQTQLV